jgi:hypothetical protein
MKAARPVVIASFFRPASSQTLQSGQNTEVLGGHRAI